MGREKRQLIVGGIAMAAGYLGSKLFDYFGTSSVDTKQMSDEVVASVHNMI